MQIRQLNLIKYLEEFGLGLQSKCVPGTERDVINIVIQRNKNTVPDSAKNLRSKINLKKKK